MKPKSFLPKTERGEKEVEWLISGYISSFKGTSWRPSQKDPAVFQ